MKWGKVFVFCLVLFSLGLPGLVMAESIPPTYQDLYNELRPLWIELNSLSVDSEAVLINMVERWPGLLAEVEAFGLKLENFQNNMQAFNEDFNSSQTVLNELNLMYAEVSKSVATLRTDFTIIEDDLNTMKFKTNIGLGISIVGALALLAYIFLGEK